MTITQGGAHAAALAKLELMQDAPKTPKKQRSGGPITAFARRNYTHFNAGTLVRAADAYSALLDDDGAMMITLAGAMSTAELGKTLAEMIRRDKVQAICCTGANLEEDVFNLIGKDEYLQLPDYANLTPEDDMQIRKMGYNRVTDTAIPDKKVVEPVTEGIMELWKDADTVGESEFPHSYLYKLLLSNKLKPLYQADPDDSWMLAAAKKQLPIVCPGWEDSTLGNEYAAAIIRGEIKHRDTVMNGVDYMISLCSWYEEITMQEKRKVGFFQIGGGIAGDFPICCVPLLQLNLKRDDIPFWAYFCQIRDSTTSYGGYSGARPEEKESWSKLDVDTPKFDIESDASIVAPILFSMVLGL